MRILDCTLRDGGYYTNWDFNKKIVKNYCRAMELLPIEYVEIGYRSIPLNEYTGQYFYCPVYVIKELKQMMPSKKLVIIINAKDTQKEKINELLSPCINLIHLVRIAVDPKNISKSITLAKEIKKLGFKTALNLMYMSNWDEKDDFFNKIPSSGKFVDFIYMVDSFGGVFPNQVTKFIALLKTKTSIKLGFHGHNNLEMALSNSLKAIEEGCYIIDSTISGMGRGAGNLKTELFLTYLDKYENYKINYDVLSKVVSDFDILKQKYQWGTNLPYMFSGIFSIPQKQIMEWLNMRRYSINTMIEKLKAVLGKNSSINYKIEQFNIERKFDNILLIGGGESTSLHENAIIEYINQNENLLVVFAGIKSYMKFKEISNKKYLCITGNEIEKTNEEYIKDKITLIYSSLPLEFGTIIKKNLIDQSFYLKKISFTKISKDSLLAIAIQLALNHEPKNINIVGFDGYDSLEEINLMEENQKIIDDLNSLDFINLISLTDTNYKIKINSIYSLL